jgi:hypothetical protein
LNAVIASVGNKEFATGPGGNAEQSLGLSVFDALGAKADH